MDPLAAISISPNQKFRGHVAHANNPPNPICNVVKGTLYINACIPITLF